jgi:hypothetical protein
MIFKQYILHKSFLTLCKQVQCNMHVMHEVWSSSGVHIASGPTVVDLKAWVACVLVSEVGLKFYTVLDEAS